MTRIQRLPHELRTEFLYQVAPDDRYRVKSSELHQKYLVFVELKTCDVLQFMSFLRVFGGDSGEFSETGVNSGVNCMSHLLHLSHFLTFYRVSLPCSPAATACPLVTLYLGLAGLRII